MVTNGQMEPGRDAVGLWTKRCYFAGRAVMDSALRPFDLGSTQWYVLYQLAHEGPTRQRDLVEMLQIERATMSGIVATLLRKGLVDQVPDRTDQRQKLLQLTAGGRSCGANCPISPSFARRHSMALTRPTSLPPSGCSRQQPGGLKIFCRELRAYDDLDHRRKRSCGCAASAPPC